MVHYQATNGDFLGWVKVKTQLSKVMQGDPPNVVSLGTGRAKVEATVL